MSGDSGRKPSLEARLAAEGKQLRNEWLVAKRIEQLQDKLDAFYDAQTPDVDDATTAGGMAAEWPKYESVKSTLKYAASTAASVPGAIANVPVAAVKAAVGLVYTTKEARRAEIKKQQELELAQLEERSSKAYRKDPSLIAKVQAIDELENGDATDKLISGLVRLQKYYQAAFIRSEDNGDLEGRSDNRIAKDHLEQLMGDCKQYQSLLAAVAVREKGSEEYLTALHLLAEAQEVIFKKASAALPDQYEVSVYNNGAADQQQAETLATRISSIRSKIVTSLSETQTSLQQREAELEDYRKVKTKKDTAIGMKYVAPVTVAAVAVKHAPRLIVGDAAEKTARDLVNETILAGGRRADFMLAAVKKLYAAVEAHNAAIGEDFQHNVSVNTKVLSLAPKEIESHQTQLENIKNILGKTESILIGAVMDSISPKNKHYKECELACVKYRAELIRLDADVTNPEKIANYLETLNKVEDTFRKCYNEEFLKRSLARLPEVKIKFDSLFANIAAQRQFYEEVLRKSRPHTRM
jgi:hypothetical protein